MKTETKSKIKKALKVGAYVGGLLLALVLGVGFGSCSEKKLQDQTSQKAEPKKLNPRFAPDSSYNLLNFATFESGLWNLGFVDGSNSTSGGSVWNTFMIPERYVLQGHRYVLTYDTGSSWADFVYPNNNVKYCISITASAVSQKILSRVAFTDYDSSLVKWLSPSASYVSPFSFDVPSNAFNGTGGSHFNYLCISAPTNLIGLYVADSLEFLNEIPSIEDISFSKTSWFPYEILGQNNSPVIAGPYNGGTMDTIEKGITDVLFSSNGRLFKGILFTFAPLAQVGSTASQQRHPSTYGYYNQDMTPIGTPQECHSDYLWYLSQVDYLPVEGGASVYVGGQRMKQFSDASQSVTQFFDWVDKRYADIAVKWAGSAVNTEITTTSGLTNLQWLENIASSVFDNTISLGGGSVDVFSLIGNGFSSITSILSIQILPYLTLGTLLLAPLVILLALAILKVLNK